ncbi:MAG: PRC-barrel domain-containing protein [Syntrophothermus sp.]
MQENGTRRVKGLLGLPVVDEDSGQEIGTVKSIVFDHRQGRLVGLVSGGKWFSRDRYLRLARIRELGRHAVILEGGPENGPEDEPVWAGRVDSPGGESSLEADTAQLIGWKVLTGSGKALGTVEDILFDAQTGRLEGMEISRGLVQDFVDGRVTIPMPDVYTVGRDVVVIPEEIGKQV